MKSIFKKLLTLLLLIGIYGCKENVCMDGVDERFVITDDAAVALTKNALKDFGLDIENLEPVHYWDGKDEYFARNATQQSDGYVLWHQYGKSTKYEYSVSIKRKGSKVYCDVGKAL